ncbi:MAG: response regulator transcription factor [Candidatus Sumerlaeaceae bacterium]
MWRILIVDDHPIVRQGVKQILAEYPEFQVAGEAETSQQVLQLLAHGKWDAVVLDISMPGRGGLETLVEIKARYPKLPVLILSMHPESLYATRALKAGASGYLMKRSATDELVVAIKRIIKGGKYVSAQLAQQLASEVGEESGKLGHELLSNREYEVFKKLAEGRPLCDIAKELSLSEKTISTYRSRIMQKLKFKTNAEVITYAIRNDLVDM